MKTLRPVGIAVGCFLALFGIFFLFASTMISVRGEYEGIMKELGRIKK